MTGMRFIQPCGNAATLVVLQGKTLGATLIWGGSTPIDVTGYKARLTIREKYDDADPAADFTVENNRVLIGGADGRIEFLMSATDSADLKAPLRGVFEIEVQTAAGIVQQVLTGSAEIKAEVCK